jgi:hypothetical protein
LSYNVVGELTGTEHPERMVVGGHLDSWDLETDLMTMERDVQSKEVLNILKTWATSQKTQYVLCYL